MVEIVSAHTLTLQSTCDVQLSFIVNIMESVNELSKLAPLAAPLTPAPEGEVFTAAQWRTLLAICDVFVPAIQADGSQKNALTVKNFDLTASQYESYLPDDANKALVHDYLLDSFTSIPNIQEVLRRKFIKFVPQDGRDGLAFVFSALNTTAGSLLLTGSTTPIHDQPLPTRTLIVSKWATSYIPLLRTLHRTFAGLSRQVWLQHTTTLPQLLDFPATPKNIHREASHPYDFHDFTSSSAPTSLSFDAIIVGSGCGAGVTASTLSRAGMKVLVVEKSYFFDSAFFPMPHVSAEENLYENGGGIPSDDSSMFVKAGSTLGGGGTINWSASLQTPNYVRNEWSQSTGLSFFKSPQYQACLDYVCERMGVAKATDLASFSNITHNKGNQILLEGARRLGMSTVTVPQNTSGKSHDCGYCSAGCPSCTKQGPVNNWLPDAGKHGAEFIQGCFVEEILFSDTSNGKERTATGVRCTWTSPDRSVTRSLTLNAPRVIVSSGTLQSPLVLQRSGLTSPLIGKNLKLHPAACVYATYAERINPWEGAILTAAVTALSNSIPATPNNGPVVECLYSVPGFAGMFAPFRATLATAKDPAGAAVEFKLNSAKFAYSTAFVIIQRDIDSGSVYQDPHEKSMVRIKYTPSKRDRAGVLKGMLAASRIAYAMDATEIDVLHPSVPRFTRSKSASEETNHEAFELWLKDVEKHGVLGDPENGMLGSAHQMGTNRMSSAPETGVVDGRGKVFGTSNIWVADGSVLPSASGVNPMISIMGVSEHIARGIVKEYEVES